MDIATHAVQQLELNPLFNSGHGAVFTREGTHELEASVMVSRGYRKRGTGVMRVSRVKSPITLAREMLVRGESDDGGGAEQHCQIAGETCDKLAEQWGLEMVKPSYFWVRKRWDEHRRGLGLSHDDETYKKARKNIDVQSGYDAAITNLVDIDHGDEPFYAGDVSWDGKEYLPQGTVGCVVLDSAGILCVATSTGGITNKLPGRIGDTPTLGAGFWSEEWKRSVEAKTNTCHQTTPESTLISGILSCLPGLEQYTRLPALPAPGSHLRSYEDSSEPTVEVHAVAMSGTGNGDSFLRLCAVRTAAAMVRFASTETGVALQNAVSNIAGPLGALQLSAEDRWHKTGEGEGGIIGIEFVGGEGKIVADFNCGGMFRCWVDDTGRERMAVFRNEIKEEAGAGVWPWAHERA